MIEAKVLVAMLYLEAGDLCSQRKPLEKTVLSSYKAGAGRGVKVKVVMPKSKPNGV